jgi:hypothetical protein
MKSKILAFSAVALFSTVLSLRGDAGRQVGLTEKYVGQLNPNAGRTEQCEFSVEIERVTFRLNSLKNKYKVVRIRAENRMLESIKLSRDEDEIELELEGGEVVSGTFNLQKQDGPLWDELSNGLRTALAYPLSVRGAKGVETRPRQPEVIYVFAFFPADKVPDLPHRFKYTIKNAGQAVKLQLPAPTKS